MVKRKELCCSAGSKSLASGKSRRQSMHREATQVTEAETTSAVVQDIPEPPQLLTLEPPPGPPPKAVLRPLDLSAYTVYVPLKYKK